VAAADHYKFVMFGKGIFPSRQAAVKKNAAGSAGGVEPAGNLGSDVTLQRRNGINVPAAKIYLIGAFTAA
jgi:hypothetical protein